VLRQRIPFTAPKRRAERPIETVPPSAVSRRVDPPLARELPSDSAIASADELASAPLRGRIHEAGTRVPLPGATVLVVPAAPGSEPGRVRHREYVDPIMPAWQIQSRSDDRGQFASAKARPGLLRVIATAPGFERFETIVALGERERVELDLYLVRASDNPYRTVVQSERNAREEVTRRSINAQEVTNLPGTQGDALKSIQNFPGVARAPFGIGLLVIRGADPTDSSVYLGEHEIPQLFHFGGLTSVFNADIITTIDYLPGNFDARYGDATGGVIDVKTRAGRRDGVHGYVDADLFDAGGLVEGPVGKGSFIVAARRSYIDAILPAVLPDDAGLDLTVAPRYWDYQGIFEYPISGGKLTLRAFGSDDRTRIVAAGPNEVSTDTRNRYETTLLFHRVDLAYENHRNGWDVLIAPSYRYDLVKAGAGDIFRFAVGAHNFYGRAEVGHALGPRARLQLGTQLQTGVYHLDAESIAIPQDGAGGQNARFSIDERGPIATPGLFATLYLDPAPWLTLIPSARLNFYAAPFRRATVDPRLRFVVRAGDHTSIRGGVGIYSQTPDIPEWNHRFGNPRLGPEHALHTSIALRHEFPQQWTAEIAAFYKNSWDLAAPSDRVVRRIDGTIGPETYSSTGAGRIVGGEIFVRKELTRNLFGWLSYTISRSERRFDPKEGWALFNLDQTHILTLIGVYRLPRHWQVGGRFRVVSGNPYTPHLGAAYDAGSGDYIAIDGKRNSARVRTFHQLDVRVDKRFVWRKVELNVYADVQNVYNHQNPEFLQDAYDYSRSKPIASLPILPSIGLRLSW
jgi:TonB-dependent Receptor Plug Domain